MVGVGLLHIAHDNVDVREVGLDEDGFEAREIFHAPIQKYNVHDVVSDVPFALNLGTGSKVSVPAPRNSVITLEALISA